MVAKYPVVGYVSGQSSMVVVHVLTGMGVAPRHDVAWKSLECCLQVQRWWDDDGCRVSKHSLKTFVLYYFQKHSDGRQHSARNIIDMILEESFDISGLRGGSRP